MEPYERAHVTIDDHFARFGSKSYALNKITSVEVRVRQHSASGWIIVAFLAALLAVTAMARFSDGKIGDAALMLIVAAVLCFPAVALFKRRFTYNYTLLLATSAGEIEAVSGSDADAFDELRRALEIRMMASG